MVRVKLAGLGIAVVIIAVILISGIAINGNFAKTKETIKIGWTGPLSGPSAVLGIDSVVAAQIAVDEINKEGGVNGKLLELIVDDDQYSTPKTVNAYRKQVEIDGVDIIMVNTYSGVFALAEQASRDGVILIDPLDCNSRITELGKNVFCLATDSESLAIVLADEVTSSGAERAGILYFNNDDFMPLISEIFQENYDGVVFSEAYSLGEKDFRTTILKMMQEDVRTLVLLGYDETGLAMKQARELGYEGKFYTTGTVTSPNLQEVAGGHAEGTVLAFWTISKDNGIAKSFTEKFIEVQGRPPILDLATYPSYDTVKAIARAIQIAGSTEKDKVSEALLSIRKLEGVTGPINFDADGGMRIPEKAHVLEDGIVKPL
jgi:branched-chain amino acid transport system substrate-binding protein